MAWAISYTQGFIEKLFLEAASEVGKGAMRGGFEEIEAKKEAKPGVVAKSSG